MQSVEIKGFQELVKRLDTMPQAVREARAEFMDETGRKLLEAVRGRIGGTGRVAGAQEYQVGSGKGYAAVRAKANTDLNGYAAGYITNSLENGHVQEPGRYIPAIGMRLTRKQVEGKHMYETVAGQDLRWAAEEGARIIEAKVLAHMEGRETP